MARRVSWARRSRAAELLQSARRQRSRRVEAPGSPSLPPPAAGRPPGATGGSAPSRGSSTPLIDPPPCPPTIDPAAFAGVTLEQLRETDGGKLVMDVVVAGGVGAAQAHLLAARDLLLRAEQVRAAATPLTANMQPWVFD